MTNINKYPMKSTSTASRVIDGEAVVVQPLQSSINTFNKVGSRIWELADGSRSIEDIASIIHKEFKVDPRTAMLDAAEFVDSLLQKDMMMLKEN